MRCPYCNYIPKCNEQTCKDCKVYEDFLDNADDFYRDLEEQRMNSEEYKSLKENADILKENALAKCNLEDNKARNYYEGYQQAIWDLMKYVKKD